MTTGNRTFVRSVTPYFSVHDAAAAIAFYTQVFGARELARYTEPSGRIGHAEMSFGGHPVMLADEHPEYGMHAPRSGEGAVGGISLTVDDVDAVLAAAEAAGATVLEPAKDEFHGERAGRFQDPFGHVWSIRTRKARVANADLIRSWVEMFGGGSATIAPPVEEVGYYTLAVPDVERGRRFYAAVFGWEFGPMQGPSYSHVDNVRLPMGLTAGARDRNPWLYYRVDDIHASIGKVRAHGGSAEAVTETKSGMGAECKDDQGVPFSLWQPAPGF